MVSKEEHILLTAEKLFAEKGFEAASTREISARANVNISMICYYFGSKEKLFEKIFEYRMNQSTSFADEITERQDLNEWEKIIAVMYSYMERVQHLRDFYNIYQSEIVTNKNPQILAFMRLSKLKFMQVYKEILEKGFEKGLFTKKITPEFLHATIIGTVFHAFNSVEIYQEFRGNTQDFEIFKEDLFEELKQYLTQLLKDLVGYEEK